MMRILLALDTSSGSTGAAIAVDGEVKSFHLITGSFKHSENLFGLIDKVLEEAGISSSDLTGVVVTRGPGAFTGLRVGIATAKGIAFGLGVDIAGVSSLRALSMNVKSKADLICPMFDARKEQVYAGGFDQKSGEELIREGAWSPVEFARMVFDTGVSAAFLGSGLGKYREEFKAVLGDRLIEVDEELWQVNPGAVALLGDEAFALGNEEAPALLKPVYHRLSEAEEKKVKGKDLRL